ncbi:MAG: RHS repeat-associated core domain-containing protein, partial [Coriobacteriia bacterium]|nr:RHS repeat-associated core domain-containing protein [Coriobacteriia bacterium]
PVTFLIATTDRGDVVALTNTAGAVFARYAYDPYGAVLSQDTNAVTGITSDVAAAIADRQPLRYAGYTYDAHSATYYLSQRHYDPATMRFLTKDPARDDGEESAYQYCGGDPVGKADPSGLRWTYHYGNRVKATFWSAIAEGWVEFKYRGKPKRVYYLRLTVELRVGLIDPCSPGGGGKRFSKTSSAYNVVGRYAVARYNLPGLYKVAFFAITGGTSRISVAYKLTPDGKETRFTTKWKHSRGK